jgi:hypothetical protein
MKMAEQQQQQGDKKPEGAEQSSSKTLDASACRSALDSAGSESILLQRAPSCSAAATTAEAENSASAVPTDLLKKCCDEIQAFVGSDERVQPCMCNRETWDTAAKRIAGAGLTGVNEQTVDAFAKSCKNFFFS